MDLTFTNSTKHKAFSRAFFEKMVRASIKELKLEKKNIGLSINLVSMAKIKTLNKKYRDKNKSTDVLSFPLHNQLLPNKTKEHILELGDIFICPDVALEKSQKSSKNFKEELEFLVVHGFLHLLGYDHEKSSKAEQEMFKLQDKILKSL